MMNRKEDTTNKAPETKYVECDIEKCAFPSYKHFIQ